MKIFVQPDGQSFRLWCSDGRMSPSPAGPRLFRAPPLPDIQFQHPLLPDAERDAAVLRRYIEQTHPKTQSKKELRAAGE